MNIDEFSEQLHAEIDEFRRFWIEQSELDPNNYPSDLEVSDWFDQVDAYNSMMMDVEDEE